MRSSRDTSETQSLRGCPPVLSSRSVSAYRRSRRRGARRLEFCSVLPTKAKTGRRLGGIPICVSPNAVRFRPRTHTPVHLPARAPAAADAKQSLRHAYYKVCPTGCPATASKMCSDQFRLQTASESLRSRFSHTTSVRQEALLKIRSVCFSAALQDSPMKLTIRRLAEKPTCLCCASWWRTPILVKECMKWASPAPRALLLSTHCYFSTVIVFLLTKTLLGMPSYLA